MENSDTLSVLNGAFNFKILPGGTIDKSKVICILCKKELQYHRSTTSLRYHLRAKHTKAANHVGGQLQSQSWQAPGVQPSSRYRPVDDTKSDRLTTALAKWVATDCRPVDIVEDCGLRDVLRLASCDQLYALPSQGTVVSRIQDLYETERNTVELLRSANDVALDGDQRTPGAGSGDDQEKELEVKNEKEQHGPLPVVSTSFSLIEPSQNSDQEMGVSLNRKRRANTETNSAEAREGLKDEDELFLLSLLPSLKRLTIKRRMEVRMKFQQILYAAEFED